MSAKTNRATIVGVVLALFFATLVGWIDQNSIEVQPTAFAILVFTATLGFVFPARAWLWALIIGLSVIAAHFIAPLIGHQAPSTMEPSAWAGLLALIPAFIGAYAGAIVRWGLNAARRNA